MSEYIPPWVKLLLYALFAVIGGVLGHLFRTIDKGEKITLKHTAIKGLSAGFAGVLFCLACQAMGMSEQWTGVIVGVAGWLGASASIKILEARVYKQMGITPSDVPVDPANQTESTKNENPPQ